MYAKRCPACGGVSYSASDHGRWLCPYCGKDLSKICAKPPAPVREASRGNNQACFAKNAKTNLLYLVSKKTEEGGE